MSNKDIRIFALGGLDENGKNLYVIENSDDIILIEAGIKYPETDQLGVTRILPDFSYVIENKDRVRGIFITHAHDDVLGALISLLKEVELTVYTTAFNAEIIKRHAKQEKLSNPRIKVIKRSDQILMGHTIVKSFPLTVSTPDGIGVAISTPYGYIVYCGEFLFDLDTRMDCFKADIAELAEIGKEKIFALMTESSGADHSGFTSPKHEIYDEIESGIEDAKGRVVVTCYEQNIYRIIEIMDCAKDHNRLVYFYNDKLRQTMQILDDLGYYRYPKKNILTNENFTNDIDDVVIIVSGIGTSVFNSMMKISNQEDERIILKESDTVIIASPANLETEVDGSRMKNELYKENVRIISLDARQIYSAHASKEDLKMMANLLKPKYYIPIKAEYRHLIANANIAFDMGMRPDQIIVLDNGQVATFEKGVLKSTSEMIETGDIMTGEEVGSELSSFVLKDREVLSTDGAIIVGVVLDHTTKQVIGGPDVQSRGLIYLKDADYIIKEVANILINTIEEAVKENRYDNMQVRMDARERITRYLLRETGKRPMILPAVVEINYSENNGKKEEE